MKQRLVSLVRLPATWFATIGVVLVAVSAVGSAWHHAYGGTAWFLLICVWAALAFLAAKISPRVGTAAGLWIILLASVAMRLVPLLQQPYLSSDIYRYVWDGRVQGAGINPYRYVPAAPELAHLRDLAIYPNINRADYAPTIYPPAAQMLFRLIVGISDGVLAMKLGLLAFEALAIVGLIGILRALSRPATSVVAYAWHPLPVWEIAGNGHLEAALLGLIVGSLWLYVRGGTKTAGIVASVAVLVKPTALLLMPVYWRPWDWKLPAILVSVATALYLPYLSVGSKVLGFLPGYVAEEELSSGSGFRYLALLENVTGPIPHGVAFYLAAAGALLAGIALRCGFRTDRRPDTAIDAFALLITAFLVLLTPHYPWYYLSLGPLLALRGLLTPWILMTGAFVLYDVIDGDRMPPFAVREAGLHLAALAALALDAWTLRGASEGSVRTTPTSE